MWKAARSGDSTYEPNIYLWRAAMNICRAVLRLFWADICGLLQTPVDGAHLVLLTRE